MTPAQLLTLDILISATAAAFWTWVCYMLGMRGEWLTAVTVLTGGYSLLQLMLVQGGAG